MFFTLLSHLILMTTLGCRHLVSPIMYWHNRYITKGREWLLKTNWTQVTDLLGVSLISSHATFRELAAESNPALIRYTIRSTGRDSELVPTESQVVKNPTV